MSLGLLIVLILMLIGAVPFSRSALQLVLDRVRASPHGARA